MRPWGPVWRIETPTGVYAVKRTRQQPDQIVQLALTLSLLHEAGFPQTMTFHTTLSGKPFARIGNENYLVSPWIEGKYPDFANQRQLQMTARLYGRFHRASSGLPCPCETGGLEADPLRTIQKQFMKKRDFLMEMPDSTGILKKPNRIDRQIIKWSRHYIRQANYCIEKLTELETKQGGGAFGQGFCHNDPAPGNIIIRNREFYLIDFELAARGLFIQETAKLMVRGLQANQWAAGFFPFIMEAYGAERELSEREMQALPILCAFPQGFWRLCSQRWEERLPWTEKRFQKRLWEITSTEPSRVQCLKSLLPDLPEPAARICAI